MIIIVIIAIAISIFAFKLLSGVLAINKTIKENKIAKECTLKTHSEIRKKIDIPDNCLEIYCIGGERMRKGTNYIWVRNENIYFFPTTYCLNEYFDNREKSIRKSAGIEGGLSYIRPLDTKFELVSIKIKDIIKFVQDGEVFHENKISGGGGGGSSIGKALVGGVIAGGAGAIIASRKKTDAITSELIVHDDRRCCLGYLHDNIEKGINFNYNYYEMLKKLIPEKDGLIVDEISRKSLVENHSIQEIDIIQKIRNLGTLKDEGILTQIEFEEKKKELLKQV
jgi:hypothetical protein